MKKALLVGVNGYSQAPLQGCVNDCLLMYKLLTEKFGFQTTNIDLLTDRESTRYNIVQHLKKLVRGIQSGDTIYFHFSGHGSQVVVDDWTNTSEADGRDEIICPIDLDWNNPLRDHEIGSIFGMAPSGTKIVVVLDCCHSGTGLRNSLSPNDPTIDYRNRFLPPPPSNILSNPKIQIDEALNFVLPNIDSKDLQTQKRSFLVSTVKQGEAILISGCQDNQTSADAHIAGKFRGALSYSIFDVLARSEYNITYKNLIVTINAFMDKFQFEQNPQLECIQGYENKSFLK